MLNRSLVQSLTVLLPNAKDPNRLNFIINLLTKYPINEKDYAKFFFVFFAILNDQPDILKNPKNKLLLQLVIHSINQIKITESLEENFVSKKFHPPYGG